MKLYFYIYLVVLFFSASCSTIPLEKIEDVGPQKIELSIVPGSYNVEHYRTHSRVKVYDLTNDKTPPEKPTEDLIEKATFKLNRKALDVDEKNRVQFQHWITQVKGKVDLASMGFPPPGKVLMSVVAPDASIVAVKDVPVKTIFYMPRISLPPKKVKSGEAWTFQQEWRSLKTGWPFWLYLNLKLENWYRCGGLECAHITYTGYVKAPKESPVSKGVLKSKIEGEFIYAPIGHQFLWTASQSSEVFINPEKKVEVSSCVTSFQIQPNKENKAFFAKYKNKCLQDGVPQYNI